MSGFAWFDRVFRMEEINGAERCPTYLYRWTLLKFRGRGVYLHHFVGDDWSLDLHDHPKRFISIGLWGKYLETVPAPDDWDANGAWEAVKSPDGMMVTIRWSVPDAIGAYLHIRHYPLTPWSIRACERQAEEFNAKGRKPWESDCYRPVGLTVERVYRAPWIRTFSAEHIHRISMIDGGDCWTLVIVLKAVRKWGFWHSGIFIPWREYVGSKLASERKACGE